jgi:hypothetical protein
VPLADGTGDDEYLAALEPAVAEAFARGRPDPVRLRRNREHRGYPRRHDAAGRRRVMEVRHAV